MVTMATQTGWAFPSELLCYQVCTVHIFSEHLPSGLPWSTGDDFANEELSEVCISREKLLPLWLEQDVLEESRLTSNRGQREEGMRFYARYCITCSTPCVDFNKLASNCDGKFLEFCM